MEKRFDRRTPKTRDGEHEKGMVFGIRAVLEAIESGQTIDKIFLKTDFTGDLAKELLGKIKKLGLVSQRVPVEKLNRITKKNHQGVIGFISPVAYYKIEDIVPTLYEEGMIPFLMILDGITDTRNFGAIARTADSAGVDAIIIPERGSVTVTPEAIKTSAGALFHIPVCREKNLVDTIRSLQASGIRVVGTSDKARENYTKCDYTVPTAIVMGAEDTGLSPQVTRLCDQLVSIPMFGQVSSLNVSVAAGIMMYEGVRQRLADGMENK